MEVVERVPQRVTKQVRYAVLERLRDRAVQPRERGGERGSTVREFQVFSSGKTSQKMMPKKLVM